MEHASEDAALVEVRRDGFRFGLRLTLFHRGETARSEQEVRLFLFRDVGGVLVGALFLGLGFVWGVVVDPTFLWRFEDRGRGRGDRLTGASECASLLFLAGERMGEGDC